MSIVIPNKLLGRIFYRENVKQHLLNLHLPDRRDVFKTVSKVLNVDKFSLKTIVHLLFYTYTSKDGFKAFGTIFTEKYILIFKIIEKDGKRVLHLFSVICTRRLFIRKRDNNHSIIEDEYLGVNQDALIHSGIDTDNILHWNIINFTTGHQQPYTYNLQELYSPFVTEETTYKPIKVA